MANKLTDRIKEKTERKKSTDIQIERITDKLAKRMTDRIKELQTEIQP